MFRMLRIYTSKKWKYLLIVQLRREINFSCFLSGPKKAYGQDLPVIKSKALSPLNGRQ